MRLYNESGDFARIANRIQKSRRVLLGLSFLFSLLVSDGCNAQSSTPEPFPAANAATVIPEKSRIWMTVNQHRFAVTLADTEAAREFAAMLPLTLNMTELNGNEKHFGLPKSLPANASRPGTIHNGDLMLYGSSTLVLFYLTFDSSFSYTLLGHVADPAGLAQTLGRGSAKIVFSKN